MAAISRKIEKLTLLAGDVFFFYLALYVTLGVRYLELPSESTLDAHLLPFSILFAVWLIVFYINGLYDKHTSFFKHALPKRIAQTQLINVAVAATFFFLVPFFAIAPKTNLFIYLVISTLFIIGWRLVVFPRVSAASRRDNALLLGTGDELQELLREVNNNSRYRFYFTEVFDLREGIDEKVLERNILAALAENNISVIVADTHHDQVSLLLPALHNLTFIDRKVQWLNFRDVYEETFDRVPLSSLEHGWFFEHFSRQPSVAYTAGKRVIDVIGALILGIITALLYPVVFVGMRLEGDRGSVLIVQNRVGRYNTSIRGFKFRTMQRMEHGVWLPESENRVTKTGNILRKTSIDEFPQFWNILKGEMSLIGPRNDIAELALRLADAIPYYNTRYIVLPGLSGWAQINQQYEPGNISPQTIEENKTRLAYDFYYIKNRSFLLDTAIFFKTLKRLFFRLAT